MRQREAATAHTMAALGRAEPLANPARPRGGISDVRPYRQSSWPTPSPWVSWLRPDSSAQTTDPRARGSDRRPSRQSTATRGQVHHRHGQLRAGKHTLLGPGTYDESVLCPGPSSSPVTATSSSIMSPVRRARQQGVAWAQGRPRDWDPSPFRRLAPTATPLLEPSRCRGTVRTRPRPGSATFTLARRTLDASASTSVRT